MSSTSIYSFKHRAFIVLILVSLSTISFGQDMYKALKREHKSSRFGIGAMLNEPLGLSFEVFKGDFCSNGNGYKAKKIIMLNVGIENIVEISSLQDEQSYDETGAIESGGMRGELGLLLPFFSFPGSAFTVQMHGGVGVEGGTRKYIKAGTSTTTNDVAGNGHIRLTITLPGFEMGHGLAFLSFNAGLKYQQVFTDDYSYLKPTFGVIIRKVR